MTEKPRERRHARTRQAILDAALEIIEEQGPEKLSMRMLAERIEYSPAGLYEYYRSKDEILAASCDEGSALLKAYLTRVPADLPSVERVVRTGVAYLKFAKEHRELYLLLFGGMYQGNAFKQEADRDASYQQLKDVIAAGIAAGDFYPREGFGLDEMAYYCWTIAHGMAMLRMTVLRHEDSEIDDLNQRMLAKAAVSLMVRS